MLVHHSWDERYEVKILPDNQPLGGEHVRRG